MSIATAALFAWLAVELGRFAIGDFRVPRPAIGLLRTPSRTQSPRPSEAGPAPAARGESAAPAPRGESAAPAPRESAAPAEEDVERFVRDRLYGERHGALRRAPTSAE